MRLQLDFSFQAPHWVSRKWRSSNLAPPKMISDLTKNAYRKKRKVKEVQNNTVYTSGRLYLSHTTTITITITTTTLHTFAELFTLHNSQFLFFIYILHNNRFEWFRLNVQTRSSFLSGCRDFYFQGRLFVDNGLLSFCRQIMKGDMSGRRMWSMKINSYSTVLFCWIITVAFLKDNTIWNSPCDGTMIRRAVGVLCGARDKVRIRRRIGDLFVVFWIVDAVSLL